MPATSDTTDFSYATPASPDTADLTGATSSNSQGSLFSATSSGLQTLDIVITNILSDNKKIVFEPYNNQFTLSDGTTGYSALHYATKIQVIGLNYLDNVNITGTPADNEVLAYDTTSSKWINQTAAEANIVTSANPVITGTISGNAFLDEDDMSSNSAVKVASQQSIKAYVDSQVATHDQLSELTDVTITGTPADNEFLAYDTSASKWINQTADEAGVITPSSENTLTNKTLTTPVIASLKPSGSNTLTMPDATDTIVGRATTDTLTNKTLTTPVINGFSGTGNASINGTFTVGVDDTGYDVKFFGATSGKYMEWDESADQLDVTGSFDVTGNTSFNGDVTFTGTSYNAVWDKGNHTFRLNDNVFFGVGTSSDLYVHHDSNNSFIGNQTGDLTITNLANDKDIIFKTDNGTGGFTEYFVADGSEGEVKLYHAASGSSSVKLATKSTGVDITGVLTTTGNIELGHASDNTLSASSGVLSIENKSIVDTGGTGLTKSSSSSSTLNLDTNSLTEAAIADGDYIVFNDATDSNAPKKEALADVATLFAGTGLSASSSVLSVDISGTTNEVEVGQNGNTITVGLPNNVTIAGNLTVNGTTTTVDTDNLTVKDSLISLARNNSTSDSLDIGFYGLYNTSGSQELYAGLFRDASDSGKFKLTKDIPNAPGDGVMGIGGTVATLVANLESTALTVTGDATFTGDSYNAVWDKSLNVLRFNDNAKIGLGGSSMGDFRMFHQSSSNNTLLQNWTGNLEISQNAGTNADIKLQAYDQSSGAVDYIVCDSGTGEVQLYHAASGSSSVKLATKSTGVDITGTITTDGLTVDGDATFTGDNYNVVWDKSDNSLEFPDGATLVVESTTGRGDLVLENGTLKFNDSTSGSNIFGAYYYGGNTWVSTNTGGLKLRTTYQDGKVHIIADDGNNATSNFVDYVVADGSTGEVQLSHYGSEKLATKSTGVNVTGVLTTDGATHDGDVTFTGADYNAVWSKAGNIFRIEDNGFITIGSNNDLYFQHDSNNSLITNQTGDLTISNTSDDKDIIISTDNQNGGVVEYVVADGSEGEVKLYHASSGSSSVKLTTKSTGIDVTGTTITDGVTSDGAVNISGAPNVAQLQVYLTSATNYAHSIECYNPNMTQNQRNQIHLGESGSSYNTATFGYVWDSAGSAANNYLEIGHWGNGDLIKVYGDRVEIIEPLTLTSGTIEFGHASDTTISRVSAGVIAVEGKNLSTVDDATALAIALG